MADHMATCGNATYLGLNHWFKSLSDRLGWIVITADTTDCNKIEIRHKKHKLKSYVSELESFLSHVQKKIDTTKDEDKINDLIIMHKKMCCFSDNVLLQIEHLWKTNNHFSV